MYNKLFTAILDSSIWLEPVPTRIVWVMFLAAMDEDGFVRMATVNNVANRANVPLEDARQAIQILESPDSINPNQELEGRRIERVDGGWVVINAKKYRDIVSREQEKATTRARVARFREKRRCNAGVTQANENVTGSDQIRSDQDQRHIKGAEAPGVPELPLPEVAGKRYHPHARTVLHFLNLTCGRSYREVDANLSVISARLNESGVDLEGVKAMIHRQNVRWGNDGKFREYLRPETLFAKGKFDGYYANRNQPVIADGGQAQRDAGLVGSHTGGPQSKAARIIAEREARAAAAAAQGAAPEARMASEVVGS